MQLWQILCFNKIGNDIILVRIGQSYQTNSCHLLVVMQEFQTISLTMHLHFPISSIA